MPSLNNESHVITLDFLLAQKAPWLSSTLLLSVLSLGHAEACLLPCPRFVPALGHHGHNLGATWCLASGRTVSAALRHHQMGFPQLGSSCEPCTGKKKETVPVTRRKESVKISLPCLTPLSSGYQSCREAVAAYYNCPEAPLKAQVLVPSQGARTAVQTGLCCLQTTGNVTPACPPCPVTGLKASQITSSQGGLPLLSSLPRVLHLHPPQKEVVLSTH